MATATLTTKGQTTVPQRIREHLGLQPGDKIEFVIESDGSVRMSAQKLSIKDLKGILPKPERARTLEEIDEAIAAAAAERALRK